MRSLALACSALAAFALLLGAGSARAQSPNPDRNAYFGEEHIHTSWSVDAWVMGNRLTGPDDAYKYAQGERSSIRWATTSRSTRRWTSWA